MPASINAIRSSPVGLVCCSSTVFGSVWDGAVSVIDPVTGMPTHHTHSTSGAVSCTNLPDGLIAVGFDCGTVRVRYQHFMYPYSVISESF